MRRSHALEIEPEDGARCSGGDCAIAKGVTECQEHGRWLFSEKYAYTHSEVSLATLPSTNDYNLQGHRILHARYIIPPVFMLLRQDLDSVTSIAQRMLFFSIV